jgi:hypothetical protein
MKSVGVLVLATIVAGGSVPASAQQVPESIVVPLSEPGRPALIRVDLVHGGITVKGTDRRDVLVTVRARNDTPARRTPPDAGNLRRLTPSPGIEVAEERNEVSIEMDTPNRAVDLEILVPLRTNLRLETVNAGDITVDGVEGEFELESVNGSIAITQASGSIVATTVNGRVTATLTRLNAQKAMAFSSLNGRVDVTFPASLRANLKLRSDNGEIYTDFAMQLRAGTAAAQPTERRGGRLRIEVNRALYGEVNGGGPEIELRSFNGDVFVRKTP